MAKTLKPSELASATGTYSIVDVRDHDTYLAGSLEGSINVPINPQAGGFGQEGFLTQEEAMAALTSLPKDKPVAVVCYHGMLSQYAADVLANLGYDAYSVSGGYDAIQRASDESKAEFVDSETGIPLDGIMDMLGIPDDMRDEVARRM